MFCYISLITWHRVSWFVSRRNKSTLFTEEGLEKANYVHKAILKRLLTPCDNWLRIKRQFRIMFSLLEMHVIQDHQYNQMVIGLL